MAPNRSQPRGSLCRTKPGSLTDTGNSFVLLNKQLRHKAFSKGIQSDLPRSLNVERCLYASKSFLLKFKKPIIMTQCRWWYVCSVPCSRTVDFPSKTFSLLILLYKWTFIFCFECFRCTATLLNFTLYTAKNSAINNYNIARKSVHRFFYKIWFMVYYRWLFPSDINLQPMFLVICVYKCIKWFKYSSQLESSRHLHHMSQLDNHIWSRIYLRFLIWYSV